ncbi:sugar O-acetyltransferase [Rhodopseudomonas boonkerdii]|uniref:sugar O-acetyltransferase n=1 Tax=Rhodopseudomonas boonkerdii TaxID=475937 RepID=UPI001E61308C|nr:sugar O-acetyltransferase [Rhodopseudomonas boonkerdii]
MTKTEKQKMLAGELYNPAGNAELAADEAVAEAWMTRYNATTDDPNADRHALLVEQLARVGKDVVIRPPFFIDYGYNISVGDGVFMNFNCVILDIMSVTIGDRTQIGPGVQLLSADHPRDAATRRKMLEFGRPVTIGADVWIGGGAIILPGVTIGNGALIGAGAVVTRNVPEGVTVVGNPARPVIPRV